MAVPPAYHESLPYIDPEPSADALAAARALIAAEQEAAPAPPAALPPPPPPQPSFTPALAAELARVAAGLPAQPLPLSRYEAHEPPPPGAAAAAELRPVLESAHVSAAYLAARAQNLALLDRHGPAAWLLHNYHLEAALARLDADAALARRAVDDVNRRRAQRQHDARAEMHALDADWRRAIARVLETELAVRDLRAQIRDELRAKAAAAP